MMTVIRLLSRSVLMGAVMSAMTLSPVAAQTGQPAAKPAAQPAKPAADKPAAPAAPAADKPAAAAAPAAAASNELPAGAPNPWVKLCSKDVTGKEACLIAQELRTSEGQFVSSVAVREFVGDPKKVLLVMVPPMVLIQEGFGVGIDKNKSETGKYSICFTNGCSGEVAMPDTMLPAMKTGQQLLIGFITVNGKRQTVPLSLAGFKAAYDGPGINPQAEKSKSDQLQDAVNKAAEEKAKKLGEKPAGQ